MDSVLDSVPSGLPALMRAHRISERAAGTGFDWDDINGVMEKAEEEWSEFKFEIDRAGVSEKNRDNAAMELGDVLFTLVNVARFGRVHPETALAGSTRKFEKRFKFMESAISETGRSMDSISQGELDALWEEAKRGTGD